MEKFISYYDYPIGSLGILEEDEHIIAVSWKEELINYDFPIKETPLILKTHRQLCEYFDGKRKDFDLPLNPKGTLFQKQCWEALKEIPYGSTRTYREQAEAIGHQNACRAVGSANHRNPIMIIIPCHRVIGSNGKLTGFRGGVSVKQALLELEKKNSKNSQ